MFEMAEAAGPGLDSRVSLGGGYSLAPGSWRGEQSGSYRLPAAPQPAPAHLLAEHRATNREKRAEAPPAVTSHLRQQLPLR